MILMFYNRNNCKEYTLPELNNSAYEIHLEKAVFKFHQDITIHLEITRDGYELFRTNKYCISFKGHAREAIKLSDGMIINVETIYMDQMSIIVIDGVSEIPVMKKYDVSRIRNIRIGSGGHCDIQYQFLALVSRDHACIRYSNGQPYIEDLGVNGIFVNDHRVQNGYCPAYGETLEIFGLRIVFLEDIIALGSALGKVQVQNDRMFLMPPVQAPFELSAKTEVRNVKYFNRAPRNIPVIYSDTVEIEAPTTRQNHRQKPLLLSIGPAFTMAIPMTLGCLMASYFARSSGSNSSTFMYTGIIIVTAAAIIGGVWGFLNYRNAQIEYEEEENERVHAYDQYLSHITRILKRKYRHNVDALNEMYPSAKSVAMYGEGDFRLWNRNISHKDFLSVRFGKGTRPFQVHIKIPKEKFMVKEDPLLEKPSMIKRKYSTLEQVPVCVDLFENRLIGLVGEKTVRQAIELMYALTIQLAGNISYTDLKLVYIYESDGWGRSTEWECFKWLPHIWSEDCNTRFLASNELERSEISYELANIFRSRLEQSAGLLPYYVVFVENPGLLEGQILAKYLLEPRKEYGCSTILLSHDRESLPNSCEFIISVNSGQFGYYQRLMDGSGKIPVTTDSASEEDVSSLGRNITGIKVYVPTISGEIPQVVDFFQMYGVSNPEEFQMISRWRKNLTYNSLGVMIGKKSGNKDCVLDIHEKQHGPHGLIAGTTGAGKSELLQTYILSLALNFSPEDISFFLIDYKGGGMANVFADLPHTAGIVSNLSGNQVHRAMISIKSENRRRQILFNHCGVNNINHYTKLYKSKAVNQPIPHLFIIVDEFAELKKELPEFMSELISVAQVGRSLGVHLILATQKPSGVVDDKIWSNSRFRLCLRVQDRQDSMDMLHKADAAYLIQTGRCYLQVGNDELYELFQTGYCGGPVSDREKGEEKNSVFMITGTSKTPYVGRQKNDMKRYGKTEKSQLNVIMQYICETASANGYKKAEQLWLPELPCRFILDECPQYQSEGYRGSRRNRLTGEWNLNAEFGLFDDPHNQYQGLVSVDFTKYGHVAVCGAAVTGKSILLQTILYELIKHYDPDEVNFYMVDFSSRSLLPFENAPHTGGVILEDQLEKLEKFFRMIEVKMEERKYALAGASFAQHLFRDGDTMPAIFLVIDNYTGFAEKTKNKYLELMTRLAREGAGLGIYMMLSAGGFSMNEIPSRLENQIRFVVALEQSDKFKYMDVLHTTKIPILPESGVPGRGLVKIEDHIYEFQTALCVGADNDYERNQRIEQMCREASQNWDKEGAEKIPEIPKHPKWSHLVSEKDFQSILSKNKIPFGYRLSDASVFGISLSSLYCYLITGKRRTGKSNAMKILIQSVSYMGGEICIIDLDGDFAKTAKEASLTYIQTNKDMVDYFTELSPKFVRRNKMKKAWISEGMEEEQLFMKMSSENPVFIFISDLAKFFHMVYHPESAELSCQIFVENILEKGFLHNIYFFGCIDTEDISEVHAAKGFRIFAGYKKGIVLGGNLNAQKLFQFTNISYAQQSKSAKKGIGYAADEEDENNGIPVVVPLMKTGDKNDYNDGF